MPILTRPSPAAGASLMYITAGALIDVWSGVRLWYLRDHPATDAQYYWTWGFLLTGAVLLLIGLAVGQIARAARHAELPPQEATPAVEQAEVNAAQRAPIVAPVNPAMATPVVPGGVAPATAVPQAPQAQRV